MLMIVRYYIGSFVHNHRVRTQHRPRWLGIDRIILQSHPDMHRINCLVPGATIARSEMIVWTEWLVAAMHARDRSAGPWRQRVGAAGFVRPRKKKRREPD
jgi:hypothetical protein